MILSADERQTVRFFLSHANSLGNYVSKESLDSQCVQVALPIRGVVKQREKRNVTNKRGKVHLTNHGLSIRNAQANEGVESRVAPTDASTVLRNPRDVIGALKQNAVGNSNPSVASERVAGDVLTIQRARDDVFGMLRRDDVANDDVKSFNDV